MMVGMTYIDTLRHTLGELVEQRRHIDADIADLQRIISRHEQTTAQPLAKAREDGRASPPGEGRRATLELLSDGTAWRPARLAKARGISTNAARAMLKKLAAETPPAVEIKPDGYKIVPSGGAQGSLSVAAEGEDNGRREVEGVVSRAPA